MADTVANIDIHKSSILQWNEEPPAGMNLIGKTNFFQSEVSKGDGGSSYRSRLQNLEYVDV